MSARCNEFKCLTPIAYFVIFAPHSIGIQIFRVLRKNPEVTFEILHGVLQFAVNSLVKLLDETNPRRLSLSDDAHQRHRKKSSGSASCNQVPPAWTHSPLKHAP